MNQPAFPAMHYDLADNEHGLTMRDYFAAKAMQGMLSENSGIRYSNDDLGRFSYELADAMLKAREQA